MVPLPTRSWGGINRPLSPRLIVGSQSTSNPHVDLPEGTPRDFKLSLVRFKLSENRCTPVPPAEGDVKPHVELGESCFGKWNLRESKGWGTFECTDATWNHVLE